jgi:nicotinamidase-related amidase
MFDYNVAVVEDCLAAYDPGLHEGALENIRRNFGLVASSEALIQPWRASRLSTTTAL